MQTNQYFQTADFPVENYAKRTLLDPVEKSNGFHRARDILRKFENGRQSVELEILATEEGFFLSNGERADRDYNFQKRPTNIEGTIDFKDGLEVYYQLPNLRQIGKNTISFAYSGVDNDMTASIVRGTVIDGNLIVGSTIGSATLSPKYGKFSVDFEQDSGPVSGFTYVVFTRQSTSDNNKLIILNFFWSNVKDGVSNLKNNMLHIGDYILPKKFIAKRDISIDTVDKNGFPLKIMKWENIEEPLSKYANGMPRIFEITSCRYNAAINRPSTYTISAIEVIRNK
jgi:hypothetical protein